MKILWFTETSTLYDQYEHFYYGCGWTESLQLLLENVPEVELFVVFFHQNATETKKINGTTYIPIVREEMKNPFLKLVNNWKGNIDFFDIKAQVLEIIDNLSPDIIHVFGTEGSFSQISLYTPRPVVYHIQGIVNPYLNTYLPINQSKFSFYFNFNYLLNNIKGNSPAFDLKRFKNQAKREAKVLKSVNYVMGRTDWDKSVVHIFNPLVNYFHVDEVLRATFYDSNSSIIKEKGNVLHIVSTLSPTVYKGIDVVLKAAKAFKELTHIDFQWEIIGLDSNSKLLMHFEKTEKIKHNEVNIKCVGKKTPDQLVKCLQKANIYVHPSYIDNSPNSVCEAQIIGLPVIACNVGGVSSIVEHGYSGFLVPSNGVFEIIHWLTILHNDDNLRNTIGQQAKKCASKRHDRETIVKKLLDVYKIFKDDIDNE